MSDSMMLVLDANRSVEAVVGSVHDIEDRKRAEQAVRESEQRFRVMADNAVDMISRHAPDGTVLFVSPSCEALTGYSQDELMGKPAEFLVYDEDVEKAWEAINSLKETDDRYLSQHRMLRKDGTVIWVETVGRLIRDASSNIVEIQCAVRDITSRKEVEEALRRKNQHLQKVLQTAPLIMFAADLQGVCTFFEGRGLQSLGIEPGEFIGKSMLDYYGNRPQMKAWLDRSLAGEEFSVEYFHEPSGRTLVGHSAQLHDAEGNREGIVVVSVDITEQKKAQEALNHAYTMLLSFAEHFPGTIFVKDESSRILFANNWMRETLGAGGWIGKLANEYLPPDIAERILADDREALDNGPILVEEDFPDIHGRMRHWRTWKFPLEREGGERLLAGISYEITEQRQAENAYRSLVDSSLQGLALVRNGAVMFANEQAAVITGYSRDELLSFTPDEVFGLVFHADHALVLDRIQRRQCGEDLPPIFHVRIVRKDGAIRKLLLSTAAIEFENTPVVQVAFLDVTNLPETR